MTADEILARLKVLFGIDAADTTHDVELQALFDTALAAARAYTGRWLYPVAKFREVMQPASPGLCCRAGGTCSPVFVTEVPVQAIESGDRDGVTFDANAVFINQAGAVFERQGQLVFPVGPFSRLELIYQGGYDELPADLAEALCQVAASAGGASVTAVGGTAQAAPVKKFTVFDVGAVEYAGASGAFASGDLGAPGGAPNAILGTWATVIDPYRDLGKSLGMGDGCVHEVENQGPIVAAAAAAAVADVTPTPTAEVTP